MVKKDPQTLSVNPSKRLQMTSQAVQNVSQTVSQSDSLQRHKINMEKLHGPTDGQLGPHSQTPICGYPLARKTYQKCGFR